MTHGQRLEAWENAARLAPAQPEAWYGLGDTYFHVGRLIGHDSGFAHAEAAFARAVALDSAFTAPLAHLVQIAILRGDASAVRRLAALYAGRDSTSESAAYLRWRVAVALGDSATARAIEAALDTLPVGVLNQIASWASQDGVAVETAWRAARAAVRRASARDEAYTMRVFMVLAANLGRFSEREVVRQRWLKRQARAVDGDAERLEEAMVLDGDPAAGRAALARLEAQATRRAPGLVACAPASWILLRPEARADTVGLGASFESCVRQLPQAATLGLRALFAARTGAPALEHLLAAVDSARLASAVSGEGNFWSLVEGVALMSHGEYARAREALRHREIGSGEAAAYWATLLRYEGRAAELAGDTLGAVQAYRHYLALRHAPDPASRSYAEGVRAALARLEPRPRT
jgi:tetratricopeptide (TPR) repeat protein